MRSTQAVGGYNGPFRAMELAAFSHALFAKKRHMAGHFSSQGLAGAARRYCCGEAQERGKRVRFQVDWASDAPNVAPEERATVADLRVFVADGNACECEESRRNGRSGERVAAAGRNVRRHDCATVSVYPLAEEIALNWWRLFGMRDAEMRLAEGRGGYALPDVRLSFDGSGFNATCRPIVYENPSVRFTYAGAERLTRAVAESALEDFLNQVLDRLTGRDLKDSGLRLRWRRVRESRQDAGESAFCEAAGALGLDPYGIHDADAEFIANVGALFDGEPLAELLSGLRGKPVRDRSPSGGVLAWLREARDRPATLSCLPDLEGLRQDMSSVRGSAASHEMPWRAGYRCARAMRRRLNIGTGERFQVRTLAARLGGRGFGVAASVPGLRAVVERRAGATHVHLRKVHSRHRHTSELFALGRAIGDAVANPEVERSAVNDLHEAARQATGRAFAAEFLAPIDEIRSMQEDGRALSAIAEDFGVATTVVERQLQNRERVREACAPIGP